MTNVHKNRQSRRHTIAVPSLCSYFNMPGGIGARTINFSHDGMYFISDIEFHPGSTVLIQVKKNGLHRKKSENTQGLRKTTLAEVRWCRQVTENPAYYQVGVTYDDSC
jgi:hypothetical protein